MENKDKKINIKDLEKDIRLVADIVTNKLFSFIPNHYYKDQEHRSDVPYSPEYQFFIKLKNTNIENIDQQTLFSIGENIYAYYNKYGKQKGYTFKEELNSLNIEEIKILCNKNFYYKNRETFIAFLLDNIVKEYITNKKTNNQKTIENELSNINDINKIISLIDFIKGDKSDTYLDIDGKHIFRRYPNECFQQLNDENLKIFINNIIYSSLFNETRHGNRKNFYSGRSNLFPFKISDYPIHKDTFEEINDFDTFIKLIDLVNEYYPQYKNYLENQIKEAFDVLDKDKKYDFASEKLESLIEKDKLFLYAKFLNLTDKDNSCCNFLFNKFYAKYNLDKEALDKFILNNDISKLSLSNNNILNVDNVLTNLNKFKDIYKLENQEEYKLNYKDVNLLYFVINTNIKELIDLGKNNIEEFITQWNLRKNSLKKLNEFVLKNNDLKQIYKDNFDLEKYILFYKNTKEFENIKELNKNIKELENILELYTDFAVRENYNNFIANYIKDVATNEADKSFDISEYYGYSDGDIFYDARDKFESDKEEFIEERSEELYEYYQDFIMENLIQKNNDLTQENITIIEYPLNELNNAIVENAFNENGKLKESYRLNLLKMTQMPIMELFYKKYIEKDFYQNGEENVTKINDKADQILKAARVTEVQSDIEKQYSPLDVSNIKKINPQVLPVDKKNKNVDIF